MYAVIETGGKQYRVEVGSEIEVERLDVEPGQTLEMDRVLLVAYGDETTIGHPLVDAAHVSASVLRQDRGDKVVVFKYRPKARRRVKHGHRQELTVLRVADIVHGRRSALQLAEAERTERERLEAAAVEEAAAQAAADKALAEKLAQARATGSGDATAGSESDVAGEGDGPTGANEPADKMQKAEPAAARPRAVRPRAPRTQAPAPEGEPKSGSRGTRKDT